MEKKVKSSQEDKDSWVCTKCTFKNQRSLTICQMCQSIRIVVGKELDKKEDKGSACPICTYVNPQFTPQCEVCGQELIKGLKDGKDIDEIQCVYCATINQISRIKCSHCKRNIRERAPKPRKPRHRGYGVANFCNYCRKNFTSFQELSEHIVKCKQICEGIIDQSQILYPKQCPFCSQSTQTNEKFRNHDKICPQKKNFYTKNPSFDRMTTLQRQTIIYMHQKCQKLHYASRESLLEKIKKLGYTEQDLDNLHHYIMFYAPIIIHVHVNTHMKFFAKDTHYRSQFETNKSSGSLSRTGRITWEDRMFDLKHHNAQDFERVKYGTINFTNDPKGVRACAGYGQSYFLLKQHVRDRCTLTDMDSASSTATIGTFRFCYHVLNKLNDVQLKAAIDGSKAKQISSQGTIAGYKQIQIHGPVQFSKDIQRLYVNKAEAISIDSGSEDPMTLVKQFSQKSKVDYQMFQYDKAQQSVFGAGLMLGPLMPSAFLPPPASLFSSGFSFGSYMPIPRPIRPMFQMKPPPVKKFGQDYI